MDGWHVWVVLNICGAIWYTDDVRRHWHDIGMFLRCAFACVARTLIKWRRTKFEQTRKSKCEMFRWLVDSRWDEGLVGIRVLRARVKDHQRIRGGCAPLWCAIASCQSFVICVARTRDCPIRFDSINSNHVLALYMRTCDVDMRRWCVWCRRRFFQRYLNRFYFLCSFHGRQSGAERKAKLILWMQKLEQFD